MAEDVLAANLAFYDAFRKGDADAMDALWARTAPVACAHPGWTVLVGRERVMSSWRGILDGEPPLVRCAEARAHVLGDAAFVTCEERLPGVRLSATNIFVREDDAWRMVHHHASVLVEEEDDDVPPGPPPTLN
jgi:ketosteroid isomerase-like protein